MEKTETTDLNFAAYLVTCEYDIDTVTFGAGGFATFHFVVSEDPEKLFEEFLLGNKVNAYKLLQNLQEVKKTAMSRRGLPTKIHRRR